MFGKKERSDGQSRQVIFPSLLSAVLCNLAVTPQHAGKYQPLLRAQVSLWVHAL